MKTNFASMTETQVSSFVTKFGDLLNAGLKASLVMDCDNGHARLNLEVILQPDSHQYQSKAGHHPKHRHPPHLPAGRAGHPPQHSDGRAGPSPSRLRRRERRLMVMRLAAARQGQQVPEPPPHHGDAPEHVQASPHHGGDLLPAVQAGPQLPPLPPAPHGVPPLNEVGHKPAVQAEHVSPLSLPLHSGSPPTVQQHTPPSQQLAHEQAHHHPRKAAAPLTILPSQASPIPPAPSYSSITLTSPKSPPRPPDQPGSPAGWGAIDPTRAESGDDDNDSEEESVLDTGGHSAQVGDEPHHAAPPPVHEDGPQQVPHHEEHEHVAPLPLIPSYPLHAGSPAPVEQPTPVRRQQYCGADLSSFCFFSPEPSEHPPPSSSSSSSSRRPSPRLHPRESLSEMRKPVKYLKCLLSQNIERAVMNRRGGRGGWVWNVSVKRDFEENMVWDSTSFHGFSYSEEYEEYEPLGHFRLENDL